MATNLNTNSSDSSCRDQFSWDVPDWRREQPVRFWDPSRKLLKAIRDYQRIHKRGALGRWLSTTCVLRYRFWSEVSGADIPLNSKIEGGLLLPYPNQLLAFSASNHNGKCNSWGSCRRRSRSENHWTATNRRPCSYRRKRRCLARCPFRSDCRRYTRQGGG